MMDKTRVGHGNIHILNCKSLQMRQALTTTNLPSRPRNPWRTFVLVLMSLIVVLAVAYWVLSHYLFPSAFTPVSLSQVEQQRLQHKLEQLDRTVQAGAIQPEPYREDDASRDITFTERELNALLARNTDLADRMAIDLSDDLASVKMLVPLDPDLPFIGGKTLKVSAGLELRISDGQPRALLKGVSVWGVPLPNAWLGNMKNIDLFKAYGNAGGFWQAVRDGVEELDIREGKLHVRLKK